MLLAWVHSASWGKFVLITRARQAQQAIDALLALGQAAEAARAAGTAAIDPKILAEHEDWYRKAAATGIALNVGRHGKLQGKRHTLATRMQAREDDYLRFARDLRYRSASLLPKGTRRSWP
jgi:hypothetical protein